MKVLVIGANAVRRLLRDPSNIFFVFIFPMLLIIVLGASFGGEFEPRLGVVIEESGTATDALVADLRADTSFETTIVATRTALEGDVERGRFEAGLVVPSGYEAAISDGTSATLLFVGTAELASQQLRQEVDAIIAEENIALVAQSAIGGPDAEARALVDEVRDRAGDVRVELTSTGEAVFPETLGTFDLGASQQLLLFVFLTSLTGSVALIQTRKWGVTRRMASTPTSSGEIVGGEALGRFGVAMVQGLFIMIGSLLIFGVNWGDPLGAATILVLFCAVGAGAGMLLGSVLDNDQQAGSVGIFASLGLAALGGCMMPLEFFSGPMLTVAHFTPHAWGLDGFAELVRHDGTIADILPELAMLSVFAASLLGLASWQLRRTLTA